jgi:predicted dithiol-disulfide oxidoreductase (DUF899 family)
LKTGGATGPLPPPCLDLSTLFRPALRADGHFANELLTKHVGSDFNFDFNVSVTEEQQRAGAVEYNYRPSCLGTDVATYARARPGMSAFALEDGLVYHAYSTYARGVDSLWGIFQWLDRSTQAA